LLFFVVGGVRGIVVLVFQSRKAKVFGKLLIILFIVGLER
jgi:hypothetical protein